MSHYIQMNLILTQTTILNTFIKIQCFSTLPLTPPNNHVQNFENQKLNVKT